MGCRVEWNVEYNEWDSKGNVDQNSKWLKKWVSPVRKLFRDHVDEWRSFFLRRGVVDSVVSVTPQEGRAVQALGISIFRRPLKYLIFLFCLTSIKPSASPCPRSKLQNSGQVGLGAAGPFERWPRMGVCVTPHTWRRSQLDGQVKMEDRRGMGERLTQRSLNYFITNGHPGWTSHYRNIYVTTNYASPRKRLAALDFALDRFGALTHMANIFTTFSTCMKKRLAKLIFWILQHTGTLWT